MEALALAYEAGFALLPARIRAGKERRGEAQTRLSASEKRQLEGFDQDRVDAAAKLATQLAGFRDAAAIVRAMHRPLLRNIESTRAMARHYHPDDVHLCHALVDFQERLAASMAAYLARHVPTAAPPAS